MNKCLTCTVHSKQMKSSFEGSTRSTVGTALAPMRAPSPSFKSCPIPEFTNSWICFQCLPPQLTCEPHQGPSSPVTLQSLTLELVSSQAHLQSCRTALQSINPIDVLQVLSHSSGHKQALRLVFIACNPCFTLIWSTHTVRNISVLSQDQRCAAKRGSSRRESHAFGRFILPRQMGGHHCQTPKPPTNSSHAQRKLQQTAVMSHPVLVLFFSDNRV